jgi:prevent-host-death family protein
MPKTVKAAEFKAKCLQLMDEVARTGEPVVVTKRGAPIAQLVPVRKQSRRLSGFMKGRVEILGDIVAPVDVEWEALR